MKQLFFVLTLAVIGMMSCQKDATSSSNSGSGACSTVQCSATTQQNVRCTRTTTSCSGLCWQHD